MNNNPKRKYKTNSTRTARNSKSAQERSIAADGVYSNGRYMHAVSLLVGCTARVITANGSIHEGIFRTFSEKFEIVLEVAHKVGDVHDNKEDVKIPQKENVTDSLIFKHTDVVSVRSLDVDLEYASRDAFAIDSAISKYNGEMGEKDLEPWDGCTGDGEDVSLDSTTLECTGNANGWDPNDMFKTNAEQYGVQTSYDTFLSGYTTPLQKKNTDEYKKAEAKANKIASEIEGSTAYKARIALENAESDGEEERFSAVTRPTENSNNMKYGPPQRRRNHIPGGGKVLRPGLPPPNSYSGNGPMRPPPHMNSSYPHPPPHHHHPLTSPPPLRPPIPHPMSSRPPISPGQGHPPPLMNVVNNQPPPPQQPSVIPHGHSPVAASVPRISPGQQQQQAVSATSAAPHSIEAKVNGDKSERDRKPNENERLHGDSREADSKSSIHENNLANNVERKHPNSRAREESVAEFKKFSSEIKIAEETKEDIKAEEDKTEVGNEKLENTVKKSTLNPNAKEFVFNPTKSFTHRSPNTQTPTPPRIHTPGTIMPAPVSMSLPIMSAPSMYSGMAPGQYLPVVPHMQMASAYAQATPMQQQPRYRKPSPGSVQPRHDFSPSIQAVAATGQPLLAPATMHTPTQFTVQYATPAGVVQTQGNQQQTMPYPQFQVYSVIGPRMVTPQGMTMVQTSHTPTYPDHHVPSQIYLSAHPGLTLQAGPSHHPGNPGQQSGGSQGGVPTPNPQHQQPPTPTQPNPPSGNPQQHLVYQSAHTMPQPPLQPSPHTPNSPQTMHPQANQLQQHNAHMMGANSVSHVTTSHGNHVTHTQAHPHPMQAAGVYGNPQTVLLISQQHPSASNNPPGMHHPHAQGLPPHPLQTHQLHHPGGHGVQHNPGQMQHLISHSSMPVQMIPVSSANLQGHPQIHYIPHPQAQAHAQQAQQNYQHNQ